MHLFICAGEPSGDLHGANLVRAIHKISPNTQITGFGGQLMSAAGAELLFPLANHPVMGFVRTLTNLPLFFRLAKQAIQHLKAHRPDAVVMIDYPGFNLALAKRIRRLGIPVHYFVPPQIWAWRTYRVNRVRRWFDTVLTALPFEETWYRERGVKTRFVGHPYFDELIEQRPSQSFIVAQADKPGTVITILPGSRRSEVTENVPLMLAAARKIHALKPECRFLIASFNEEQAAIARKLTETSGLPIEAHVGKTAELIELANCCIAVSGSVGLELMYRLKPTVVVYRVAAVTEWIIRRIIQVRYISLVNLLANEEVFPEYPTSRDDSGPIARHIIDWLNNPQQRELVVKRLREVKSRVAIPGACERAAEFLLSSVRLSQPHAA